MSSPAWSWRHAITQSDLPANTRLVLLTLSCHMNEHGRGCFPSQEQLAAEAGLDRKTIRRHLERAEEAGWIRRTELGLKGQKWRLTDYRAVHPAEVANGGGDASEPPPCCGAQRDNAAPAKVGAQCPQPLVEGGGNDDHTLYIDSKIEEKRAAARSGGAAESAAETAIDAAVLEARLRAAASRVLIADSPHLADLTLPLQWLASGYDLERDVLPAIQASASKMKRARVRSWKFFEKPVERWFEKRRQAADLVERRAPPPEPEPPRVIDPSVVAGFDDLLFRMKARRRA